MKNFESFLIDYPVAYILEELSEGLEGGQKYADFNGHQVVVDSNTGVIQSGKFKGKKVNLVKDRQRNIKKIYKQVDKGVDATKYSDKDKKFRREHEIEYAKYGYEHKYGHDSSTRYLPCMRPKISIQNDVNKALDDKKKEYVKKKTSNFRVQKAKSDDEYRNRYKKKFDTDKHHMHQSDVRAPIERKAWEAEREAERKAKENK